MTSPWLKPFSAEAPSRHLEYWTLDPIRRETELHGLDENGHYKLLPVVDGVFHSNAVPGSALNLAGVFAELAAETAQ